MKIAITTSVSGKSAKQLADHLKINDIEADVFRPFKDKRVDFRDYDYVFAYGCSAGTLHKQRLNTEEATLNCVDKRRAFKIFNMANVPTVRWWVAGDIIPKDVECLVLRPDACGRKAEDLSYWQRGDGALPRCELYTEYFEHIREYRVTVFLDQTFVYFKRYNEKTDMHEFILDHRPRLFRDIIQACQRARVGLGIDYASFDILEDADDKFAVLEANSGSILTDEVSEAIVEYFLNKE